MPIYEYRCKKGHTFELLQPIHDDPIDKCHVCGAHAERVLFAPALHFKGSGFYNTDYGTQKRSREEKATAEAAKKTESKDAEKKTESSGSSKSDSGTSDSGKSDAGKSDSGKSDSKPAAPAKSGDS